MTLRIDPVIIDLLVLVSNMFDAYSVLAIIPARGGSKRLPGKNLLAIDGVTLLERTLRQAQQSRYIDRIILSSEDPSIQRQALKIGLEVPFSRPVELATDDSSSIDVVRHALKSIKKVYDLVVLLQVTSPLRSSEDIDRCIERCVNTPAPACVSVVASNTRPDLMFSLERDDVFDVKGFSWLKKSSNSPKGGLFVPNGAVYVAKSSWIMKAPHFLSSESVAYIMPKIRSFDLDDEEDWAVISKLVLAE